MASGKLDSVVRNPRRDLEDDCMFMIPLLVTVSLG
jgi:hypothetical protein